MRNLAKDVEEEKTLEVKIRDLEWDFQSRMLQKEKDFADEKKKMQQKEAKLKAEIAKKAKENTSLTEDMVSSSCSSWRLGSDKRRRLQIRFLQASSFLSKLSLTGWHEIYRRRI